MTDVMGPATNEHAMRMGHALVLNALVLISAWRFVRGVGVADAVQRAVDTVLLWLAIQYASVTVCGVFGVLNAWTMTVAALLACGAMWWLSHRHGLRATRATQSSAAAHSVRVPDGRGPQCGPYGMAWERYVAWACVGFLVGYGGAVLWNQYFVAVMSDDALTYHVPAAVRWLQEGRLVLHEVWFFNPANTYSPLAGSAFIAWWFAPLGNDWAARFVQAPGLALIFVAMIRLGRLLGAPLSVAVLVALAAGLSRPFMRQILVTKDDLYLAGFFIAAVVALARDNASERVGPWRVGAAVGLFLATKYTALLAMPALLLMVDGPVRAKWRVREWAIAAGVAAVIAGPWFVRNWWLTGNPLFPIDVHVAGVRVFEGLFTTARSEALGTAAGVWRILTDTHFSMLPLLFTALAVAWVVAAILAGKRMLREPLIRVCVLGPLVGIGLFILASPYAEVRFVDPAFLLMFASAAFAFGTAPRLAGLALAVFLVWLSLYTGFVVSRWTFIGGGIVAMLAVVVAMLLQDFVLRLSWRGAAGAGVAAALAIAAYLYVRQDVDVRDYRQLTDVVWKDQYGAIAEGWEFVRTKLPEEAVVAYTNSQFAYPLMGFGGRRRVAYAPTRPGVASLHTLPRLAAVVTGEQLVREVAAVTVAEADREVWMKNLQRLGAKYLFIARTAVVKAPPELEFAQAEPGRFEAIFENEAVVIYRIRWEGK